MERRRFGNTDLMVSTIGLGCYGMSGAYGPAEDAESGGFCEIARHDRSHEHGSAISLKPD